MKKLSILLALIMHSIAFSQEWNESYRDESVLIEFSKINYINASDGINHERLIFKYTNLTNDDITISFDRKIAYDNVELALSDERKFSVSVPSNSSIAYSEKEKYNKLFYLFVSDNKGTIKRRLSNFEILNIEKK